MSRVTKLYRSIAAGTSRRATSTGLLPLLAIAFACGLAGCLSTAVVAQEIPALPTPLLPAPTPLEPIPTQASPIQPNPVIESVPLGDSIDVLGQGPMHEAFAQQDLYQDLGPSIIAPVPPPEPIDELPPEYELADADAIWIPGYWMWDEERQDYIWVSGVWRVPPTGLDWLPGYWTEVEEGYARVSGMWHSGSTYEAAYVPVPPQSLDLGPTSQAPTADCFWVSGSWVFTGGVFRWQPGYWAHPRAGLVWIAPTYIWSPRGCLYRRGYWDFPLSRRGMLFSPIYVPRASRIGRAFVYRPSILIRLDRIALHLFARPGRTHYFFGNYYDARYRANYRPWFDVRVGGRIYDPFFANSEYWGRSRGAAQLVQYRDAYQRALQNEALRPNRNVALNSLNSLGRGTPNDLATRGAGSQNSLTRRLNSASEQQLQQANIRRVQSQQRNALQQQAAVSRQRANQRREREEVSGTSVALIRRSSPGVQSSTSPAPRIGNSQVAGNRSLQSNALQRNGQLGNQGRTTLSQPVTGTRFNNGSRSSQSTQRSFDSQGAALNRANGNLGSSRASRGNSSAIGNSTPGISRGSTADLNRERGNLQRGSVSQSPFSGGSRQSGNIQSGLRLNGSGFGSSQRGAGQSTGRTNPSTSNPPSNGFGLSRSRGERSAGGSMSQSPLTGRSGSLTPRSNGQTRSFGSSGGGSFGSSGSGSMRSGGSQGGSSTGRSIGSFQQQPPRSGASAGGRRSSGSGSAGQSSSSGRSGSSRRGRR